MKHEPIDVIVYSLTISIVVFVSVVLISAAKNDAEISENNAEIIKALLVSVIAIVSMYVGSKLNQDKS